MTSIINTTNIDTAYPIAGQDNDSQGFRDNFTNTNTNFVAAKDEIEDLQSKVILKAALLGDTLDNDFAGAVIKSAQVEDMRGTVLITTGQTGPTDITVSAAPYQKITPVASVSLSFLSFSPVATHSTVQLEIEITNVGYTVTLPAAVSIGIDGLQNIEGQVFTFPTVGTYIFEFASRDGGATIVVNDLTQGRRQILVAAPAASIGAAGDLIGMVAFDATYIYLCTADYDGATSIWHRALAASW